VDLTTGALVRAGRDFPVERLRTELRANVDVFCAGALRSESAAGPRSAPLPRRP